MPIKVSADGLSIVTTSSDGKAVATIPDICKIPCPPGGPVPVPFPNIARSKDVTAGSILTRINGGNVAVMGSFCRQSSGDEGGVLGGVVSGCIKGKGFFMKWSPTVKVEGRPVCRKSDMMIMNTVNTVSLSGMNQEDVNAEEISVEPVTIEIELKDEEGNPVADEKYIVKHSGKVTHEGKLDANGYAKVEGVHGMGYKIMFPELDSVEKE